MGRFGFLQVCLLGVAAPLVYGSPLWQLSPEILKAFTENSPGAPLLFQVQPQQQIISQSQQIQEIPVGTVASTATTLPQVSFFAPSSSSGSGISQSFHIPNMGSGAVHFGRPSGSTFLSALSSGNSGLDAMQSYGGGLNSYLQNHGQILSGGDVVRPMFLTVDGNIGASYGVLASSPPRTAPLAETILQSTGQYGNIETTPYTGASETILRPSYNVAEPISLQNTGSSSSSLLNSGPVGSGTQYSTGNTLGTTTYPAFTRPFITFVNKPINGNSGSYSPNNGVIFVKPVYQNSAGGSGSAILTSPNAGVGGYVLSNGGFMGSHVRPAAEPTAQISQLPCTLHVPNPVPITVTSGATQVTTPTFPGVPASYIDHSPPTVGILRPPSSSESESIVESETVMVPVAAPTSTSSSTILLKSKEPRSPAEPQDDNNDESSKSDHSVSLGQGLARNGLPFIYTLMPSSILTGTGGGTSISSSVPTSFKSKNRNPASSSSSSSSSRTSQRKNPFFNVNKRKHFEYYEYF